METWLVPLCFHVDFSFHTAAIHEQALELGSSSDLLTDYSAQFHFFPGKGDEPVNPHKLKVHYVRWRFDPNAKDSAVEPTELVNINGEFPKVDDRVLGKKYNIVFLAITHVERDASASMVGPSFNSIAMCDVSQGTYRIWYAGHDTSVGEAVFVPRSPNGKQPRMSMILFYLCSLI